MNISRKQFLLLGSASTLAVVSVPLSMYLRDLYLDRSVPPETRAKIAAFFKEQKAAGDLGRSYLEQHPDENDEIRLARRVFEKITADGQPLQSERFVESLREAHIRDWDEENTVMVGGWVLTEIETLLCALAARSA